MIYTFGNCKAQFAPYVASGRCVTDPSVLDTVNEAMMRLLMLDTWKISTIRMQFKVTHNVVVLPDFVESILSYRTICGVPGNVWNMYYDFAASGPASTDENGNSGNDLIDFGISPTFYPIDINKTVTLAAFSTSLSDASKTLHIRGTVSGAEAVTAGEIGITLPINQWQQGVVGMIQYDTMKDSGTSLFSEVSHVIKPITIGYVTLISIDKTTKSIQILGVYSPWETTPGFRRYKIVNHDHNNGTHIVAACKLRYVPMRGDNDPLILQNPPAVIAMLQAMNAERAGNVVAQSAFEQKATGWLMRQAIQVDEPQATLSVVGHDWGMGDVVNYN